MRHLALSIKSAVLIMSLEKPIVLISIVNLSICNTHPLLPAQADIKGTSNSGSQMVPRSLGRAIAPSEIAAPTAMGQFSILLTAFALYQLRCRHSEERRGHRDALAR